MTENKLENEFSKESSDAEGFSVSQMRRSMPPPPFGLDARSTNSISPLPALSSTQPIQRVELAAEETMEQVEGDVDMEFLAHDVAYADSLTPSMRRRLASLKYHVPQSYVGALGFEMKILRPKDSDGAPEHSVAIFRGTDDFNDVLTDLDSAGAGLQQFRRNRSLILRALNTVSEPMVFTGHSLGGALAQMIAASSLGNSHCARIVTFQSPGISAQQVRRFDRFNQQRDDEISSTHYRARHDLVDDSGEAFTPGTTYEFDFDGMSGHQPEGSEVLNAGAAHGSHPLGTLSDAVREGENVSGFRATRNRTHRPGTPRLLESFRREVLGMDNPEQYENRDDLGDLLLHNLSGIVEGVIRRLNTWLLQNRGNLSHLSKDQVVLFCEMFGPLHTVAGEEELAATTCLFLNNIPLSRRQALQSRIVNVMGLTDGFEEDNRNQILAVFNTPSARDRSAVSESAEPIQNKEAQPIQRVEELEQADNQYVEENFTRLTNNQRREIATFSFRAHELMERWTDIRPGQSIINSELSFQSYRQLVISIFNDLSGAMIQMEANILRHPTHNTMRADETLTFINNPLMRQETYRQLNSGHFPQYLREIITLHSDLGNLIQYQELFNEFGSLEISFVGNEYELYTIFGGDLGAGEGLTGGASVRRYRIQYSNDLGMAWSVNVTGGVLRGGVGLAVSPIEANIDTSGGENSVNAGSASSQSYRPPSYFEHNMINVGGMEIVAGGGASVGWVAFGALQFNTSGGVLKIGTAVAGQMGAEFGMGYSHGGDVYDYSGLGEARDVEKATEENEWQAYIRSLVYFRTEESALDTEDFNSIADVLDAIKRHDSQFPGDVYQIEVIGTASERWETPEQSARESGMDVDNGGENRQAEIRRRLNNRLARQRGQLVVDEINRQAGLINLTRGGHGLSNVRLESTIISNQGEEDNAATARMVYIRVSYKTSQDGNILLNGE